MKYLQIRSIDRSSLSLVTSTFTTGQEIASRVEIGSRYGYDYLSR
jgi:hypothetical protein